MLESTYDEIVLTQSRDIINHFKKTIGEYSNYESEITVGGDDIDITVKFVPKKDLYGHTYSIQGYGDIDTIDITIEYVKNSFPAAYNDFIAELKESIRHEIEHIAQKVKGKLKWQKYSNIPFYKYLLLRHEVPAYVNGLYKRAKTKRQTITQAIDEYIKEYENSFTNDSEKQQVRHVWLEWAKNNLPKVQF